MVSFVRQYVISLNYLDGAADPKALTSREKLFALKEKPKFVEYFTYMFFCGYVMVGPFVEFYTFSNFIHLRGHYKEMPLWG